MSPTAHVRLSAPDAFALHTQTATTPAHSVSLVVLAPSAELSHDRLTRWIASALPRSSRFRSRLVDKPFGLGQPIWAEITDFDPVDRIRQATVAAPGGDRQLASLVEDLSATPLPASMLWRAWTVGGLAEGRWAVAIQTSPVVADSGQGRSAIWDRLLTSAPDADHASWEHGPGSPPSLRDLVADTLSEMVENQLTGALMAVDMAAGAVMTLGRRFRGLEDPAGNVTTAGRGDAPLPSTAMNARLTTRRSLALSSVATADVRAVSEAFGGSAANVVLAACTLSLRAWLQHAGNGADEPLVMSVSLPPPTGGCPQAATSLPAGHVRAPVQLADPVRVLTSMHTATERMTNTDDGEDENYSTPIDLAHIVALFPPRMIQFFAGLGVNRWNKRRCHAMITFREGPPGKAFCAGAEVLGLYTAEPLIEGCGLGVVVTSHGEVMGVCVSACPDNITDVGGVAEGIAEAMRTLREAAAESPRGTGQSVVSEMASHSLRRTTP